MKPLKIPQSPPNYADLMAGISTTNIEAWTLAIAQSRAVDPTGRYLHWDEMRYRTPPNNLTHDQWWFGTSTSRNSIARDLPLVGTDQRPFRYCNIDLIQEMVHRIDQQASGHILTDRNVTSLRSSDRYLVSSLVEEAITSSQLEGASTTRRVAKELLQTGRRPRDRSEQMIVNNYTAMLDAEELARSDADLTPNGVLDLHRVVTDGILDEPTGAGRLQTADETRIGVYWTDNKLLHKPPPAGELPARLEQMCAFANGELDDGFIHPVVRAIVLHFWLAYDHPFIDGNGRTARALFYWSMLRADYWLTQYISISSVLRKAPSKYARSYLYTETDGNDLTYFIIYQLEVIDRALTSLQEYLARKVAETKELERLLKNASVLNHRQFAIIGDALRDAADQFTIKAQSRRHRVTYQTARTDLLGLAELNLFEKRRIRNQFVFVPYPDLATRLQEIG